MHTHIPAHAHSHKQNTNTPTHTKLERERERERERELESRIASRALACRNERGLGSRYMTEKNPLPQRRKTRTTHTHTHTHTVVGRVKSTSRKSYHSHTLFYQETTPLKHTGHGCVSPSVCVFSFSCRNLPYKNVCEDEICSNKHTCAWGQRPSPSRSRLKNHHRLL